MRLRNAETILQAVRLSAEISRADLARLTELSPATVSSIVDELISAGFLSESGARSSGMGRRPIGLIFNAQSLISAGVRIDNGAILLTLIDLNARQVGEILEYKCESTDVITVSECIVQLLKNACKQANVALSAVAALGIAAPGPIKDESSGSRNSNYIALRESLARKLPVPVQLKSMVAMAALAEGLTGEARQFQTMVYFRVGHAVRSAVLLERNLVEGKNQLAGEVGHTVVPDQPWVCPCGKTGCVNGIAALPNFLALCQKDGLNLAGEEEFTSHISDSRFIGLLTKCAQALAFAIAPSINLMAPDSIVLSAPYLVCGERFKGPFIEALSRYTQSDLLSQCKITYAQAPGLKEAVGAGLFALEKVSLTELLRGRLS